MNPSQESPHNKSAHHSEPKSNPPTDRQLAESVAPEVLAAAEMLAAEAIAEEALADAGMPREALEASTSPTDKLAAEQMLETLDRGRVSDLISLIKESADKLAEDHTSRGDLKILSRTLRELRYAFKVFSPYRKRRKVTVFGSARTPTDDPAYQQAVSLGQAMAREKWLVVTGAASGIMEAGHLGAGRENSMGLNIMLPFEQSANSVIAGDPKLVHMKYFFTRKLMFVKECDAVCLLPGGFGTLDEGLEVLTLLQTGKRDMVPVVFLDAPGGDYWQDFHKFVERQLLRTRMISPEDFSLYKLADSVDAAVAEMLGFYRVYHSMRYARNRLIFRLHSPISEELLEAINVEFNDILVDGAFKQSGPVPEERDEPELALMTRLTFHFNRRSLGRLRQLIDSLNAGRIVTLAQPNGSPAQPIGS